jgi:hypothetical protein
MKRLHLLFPLFVIITLVIACKAKVKSDAGEDPQKPIALKRGDIISCGPPSKEFGTVKFTSACKPSTQEDFNLGMAMLHSFEYDESEKAFARVLDADPGCAMAYWGVAMSNFHQVWPSPASPAELEKGSAAVAKARSLETGDNINSDYINAIGAFYNDYSKYTQRERILNYAKEMEEMYKKYPSDKEVAVFYALSLVSAADPNDKTFAYQKKAGKILNELYPGQPSHPGIVHYIIHAYDSPELASHALEAARKYASLAPASAHAQHMPSHIFTRLGLWDEAIQSNSDAAESARCYAENTGIKGHWDEELHAIDYLVYAYLQKGDNKNALQQMNYLKGFTSVEPVNFKVLFAFAATPGRYYLENKLWNDAATMQFQAGFPWEKYPWQKGIVHFTRSLGLARIGKASAARDELNLMKHCHDSLKVQRDDYKANQVAIQMKLAEAWILFSEGKKDQALQFSVLAADMEDKTEKSPVTPGEVLPARQLLGDMLMEMNRPADALIAYEADLKKHPNRLNSIAGAARASEVLQNTKMAKLYWNQLLNVASQSGRDELVYARAYPKKG